MNENSRYAAGLDIGTTTVRCVVASLESKGKITIVGVGEAENSGMKKGVISHLEGPGAAVDSAIADAEQMSGFRVENAAISINGSHILSHKSEGMIAITSPDKKVSEEDIDRIEEVSTVGKIPANREILSFIPYSYSLDGQDGISNAIGMTGSRLEVKANVVSAMAPHFNNLNQFAEDMEIIPTSIVPSVMASARAVLTDKQRENGVAVIDLGASTTGVAVYENGDLQYARVIPLGGINITNDLAICLKITPEIAEEIKIKHSVATPREEHRDIMAKSGREHYSFNTSEIDEIIEARLEEIFDNIRKELKNAGYDKQLPSGIVLTGGGANMKGIAEYSKKMLELASVIGEIEVENAISENIKNPEYAAAVGLMLIASQNTPVETRRGKKTENFWDKIFHRNK